MSASAANCDTVSSEQHLPLAADEGMAAAFVPAVSVDSSKLVILKCNKKYFKSRDCPLRLAELVCTLVFLALATSCRSHTGDYLSLPFSEHLRFAVFTCTAALLVGLFVITIRLSSLVQILPVDWNMFDLMVYGMLSMLFLITSFLAVGDLVNYATKPHVIPEASLRVYGVSVVFAFLNSILHGTTAVFGCRRRRWIECFGDAARPQRILLSQQSSVSTVTGEMSAN